VTIEVLDTGIGSAGIVATRRKPISEYISSHRGDEGGYEELNVRAKPEQK
jgi:hypothetical protein